MRPLLEMDLDIDDGGAPIDLVRDMATGPPECCDTLLDIPKDPAWFRP